MSTFVINTKKEKKIPCQPQKSVDNNPRLFDDLYHNRYMLCKTSYCSFEKMVYFRDNLKMSNLLAINPLFFLPSVLLPILLLLLLLFVELLDDVTDGSSRRLSYPKGK